MTCALKWLFLELFDKFWNSVDFFVLYSFPKVFIMNSLMKKLLKVFIFFSSKVEKIFGLSDFSFHNKRFKILTLISFAMKITFLVLYPFACLTLLEDFIMQGSGITLLARNITFAFNWLLLFFIYGSEFFTSNQQIEDKQRSLFLNLIQIQSLKQNVLLLMRCTLKTTALLVGLIRTNSGKYTLGMKTNMNLCEEVLLAIVFLPFIILGLVSNRIYVANNIVRYRLLKNVQEFHDLNVETATMIEFAAVNHRSLHDFFIAFNKSNEINLLTFLTFSILNIAYQVSELKILKLF